MQSPPSPDALPSGLLREAASCTRFCCSRLGRLGTWCETARVCEGADWGECTENVDAMLVDESRGDSSEDYGNVTAFAALATDDTRRRAPYVEGTSEAFFERTPAPTPAPESSFWWYVGLLRTYVTGGAAVALAATAWKRRWCRLRDRGPAACAFDAELEGSIGEGPNHSNCSHQRSVKILSKFNPFC